jgi:hypothetical protein
MLTAWVYLNLQEKIVVLLPPENNNGNDIHFCKDNASGIFSIAEMYHALCDYERTDIDMVWKSIWRLKVSERVRAFVWLVKHGRLLTNERKHKMGLGSDQCDYCRDRKETTLHALRDCVLVRSLWLSVVDISVRHQFFSSSLDDWIAMNVVTKNGKNTNDDWSNYWAMACHHAWTWRNKENHDAEFLRPIRQPEFVRQRLKCYSSADRVMQDVVHQQQTIIHVGWNPPLQGWVCLNVDGASRNGVIGCVGVVRGSVGEWVHGFRKIIGRGEIYIAELWGVLEGMRLARRMNFYKVEVRINSLGIVKDINRKQASKMCGRALIRKIVDLLVHDWEVIFKHFYREANHLADALAKHSFLVKDEIGFFQGLSGFL